MITLREHEEYAENMRQQAEITRALVHALPPDTTDENRILVLLSLVKAIVEHQSLS